MNKLEELKRAKREADTASSYIAQCEAGASLHSCLFELLPDLIAVAEAAKRLRTSHRACMESPSFYSQSVYEGAQKRMDEALLPLTKDTDK